jgi:starch synthase
VSNAAIYFHPEGYHTDRLDLKGRHVAGESFLTGFFQHAKTDLFACYAASPDLARLFIDMANRTAPGRPVELHQLSNPATLSSVGCLFVPGPGIDSFAWRRRAGDQRAYSLCGVTHTTAETPNRFGDLITAPVQPWDAVICTSWAARASVEAILSPYLDYLNDRFGLSDRFGAGRTPLPHLPVIPLGIDTAAFRFTDQDRAEERQKLGIGADDIVVLFVGRLHFHGKAHPLPMYLALERTARRTGRRIHLIQAGWFGHDVIADAFIKGAQKYCPSVNPIFLDGRRPTVRTRIWAAADIFTSLVDNIQETFGITPIEAMATGLPGVISDWNGYRETLRHGIDGFRIPTVMPPPGTGADFADAYAAGIDAYDLFIGRTSQVTAVDIDAATEAYSLLVTDADLRRRMGAAAQSHAAAVFDWKTIIPQYQDVWQQLAEARRHGAELAPARPNQDACPLWPDPMRMFHSYPTRTLSDDMILVRADGATAAAVAAATQELQADTTNSPVVGILCPPHDMALALEALDPPGRRVDQLLALVPPQRQLLLLRSLVHLMKFGLIKPVPALVPTDLSR